MDTSQHNVIDLLMEPGTGGETTLQKLQAINQRGKKRGVKRLLLLDAAREAATDKSTDGGKGVEPVSVDTGSNKGKKRDRRYSGKRGSRKGSSASDGVSVSKAASEELPTPSVRKLLSQPLSAHTPEPAIEDADPSLEIGVPKEEIEKFEAKLGDFSEPEIEAALNLTKNGSEPVATDEVSSSATLGMSQGWLDTLEAGHIQDTKEEIRKRRAQEAAAKQKRDAAKQQREAARLQALSEAAARKKAKNPVPAEQTRSVPSSAIRDGSIFADEEGNRYQVVEDEDKRWSVAGIRGAPLTMKFDSLEKAQAYIQDKGWTDPLVKERATLNEELSLLTNLEKHGRKRNRDGVETYLLDDGKEITTQELEQRLGGIQRRLIEIGAGNQEEDKGKWHDWTNLDLETKVVTDYAKMIEFRKQELDAAREEYVKSEAKTHSMVNKLKGYFQKQDIEDRDVTEAKQKYDNALLQYKEVYLEQAREQAGDNPSALKEGLVTALREAGLNEHMRLYKAQLEVRTPAWIVKDGFAYMDRYRKWMAGMPWQKRMLVGALIFGGGTAGLGLTLGAGAAVVGAGFARVFSAAVAGRGLYEMKEARAQKAQLELAEKEIRAFQKEAMLATTDGMTEGAYKDALKAMDAGYEKRMASRGRRINKSILGGVALLGASFGASYVLHGLHGEVSGTKLHAAPEIPSSTPESLPETPVPDGSGSAKHSDWTATPAPDESASAAETTAEPETVLPVQSPDVTPLTVPSGSSIEGEIIKHLRDINYAGDVGYKAHDMVLDYLDKHSGISLDELNHIAPGTDIMLSVDSSGSLQIDTIDIQPVDGVAESASDIHTRIEVPERLAEVTEMTPTDRELLPPAQWIEYKLDAATAEVGAQLAQDLTRALNITSSIGGSDFATAVSQELRINQLGSLPGLQGVFERISQAAERALGHDFGTPLRGGQERVTVYLDRIVTQATMLDRREFLFDALKNIKRSG